MRTFGKCCRRIVRVPSVLPESTTTTSAKAVRLSTQAAMFTASLWVRITTVTGIGLEDTFS